MSNKVTGEIIDILPTEKGTSKAGKDWQKLTFAIDTKQEYNNIIAFEVFGDEKVENFLKYNKIGKTVDVEYNISSNKWQDRYFTSASAWRITNANDTETALNQAANAIDTAFPPAENLNESEDDLPF
tara:strand:+ start:372 stop:752 length:381 start_codon:yes stop_codon:yes gene_type:complete